jgi:hypothetical protein
MDKSQLLGLGVGPAELARLRVTAPRPTLNLVPVSDPAWMPETEGHSRAASVRGARSARAVVGALAVVILAGALGASTAGSAVAAHGRPRSARILFGLGTEADGARSGHLAKSAHLGMLSSWYNGPSDLAWMGSWETSEVPRDYAAGYEMHLIVWSGEPRATFSTGSRPVCGQRYPLSEGFLSDMERLARIFRPPAHRTLYVTLFSEFQTYACDGNEWSGSPQTTAYYEALKAQYMAALTIFHRLAPGSQVSLGWGGWQARWNGPETGAGRSLFQHFADVMRASDFESFEVINSNTDTNDIRAMTQQLRRYGRVMLAYYRPPEGDAAATQVHLRSVLAPAFLAQMRTLGMFAMAFMNEEWLAKDPAGFAIVQRAVKGFGCTLCGLSG